MIVACRVIDFVDGINDVDDVLHGDGLVGTEHHRGLAVVAYLAVDEVGELGFVGSGLVDKILELLVHINGDGLLGHGLAVARRQHELDGVRGDQGRGQHEENQQEKHQVRHGRGVERRFDLVFRFYGHNALVLSGFIQDIHKFSRLGFKQVDDLLDFRRDDGVEEVGDDADNQTTDGGHHGFVDAR